MKPTLTVAEQNHSLRLVRKHKTMDKFDTYELPNMNSWCIFRLL